MKTIRTITVVAVAALLLATAGCKKKKPPVPQAQVPSTTAPAQQPPVTQTTAPATAAPAQVQPPATQAATKPKPRPKRVPAKPKPTTTAKATPPGTSEQPTTPPAAPPQEAHVPQTDSGIQISPRAPHTDATHSQQSTQQLIDTTEGNLGQLKRSLSSNEHAMVGQIRSYLEQARKAIAESDLTRAHNLALKAHLLSDELMK